jgi:hypothetical protein
MSSLETFIYKKVFGGEATMADFKHGSSRAAHPILEDGEEDSHFRVVSARAREHEAVTIDCDVPGRRDAASLVKERVLNDPQVTNNPNVEASDVLDTVLTFFCLTKSAACLVRDIALKVLGVLRASAIATRLYIKGTGGVNKTQLISLMSKYGNVHEAIMINNHRRSKLYGSCAILAISLNGKLKKRISYVSNGATRWLSLSIAQPKKDSSLPPHGGRSVDGPSPLPDHSSSTQLRAPGEDPPLSLPSLLRAWGPSRPNTKTNSPPQSPPLLSPAPYTSGEQVARPAPQAPPSQAVPASPVVISHAAPNPATSSHLHTPPEVATPAAGNNLTGVCSPSAVITVPASNLSVATPSSPRSSTTPRACSTDSPAALTPWSQAEASSPRASPENSSTPPPKRANFSESPPQTNRGSISSRMRMVNGHYELPFFHSQTWPRGPRGTFTSAGCLPPV